ncbi:MAG: TonB-dependent receptor [Verrucomicrobia bacterium]|nr:TonB-dependent receptor [Verrucomicrobiota bacterium]
MSHPRFSLLLSTVSLTAAVSLVSAQPAPDGAAAAENSSPIKLEKFVVTDELDRAREDIVPNLGATSFQISITQLSAQPQGPDAAFNQVLLRVPGVAQDSGGQVHLRGEHANLQYRINDVLLPEGVGGFAAELDTRLVDTVAVLTGSLPAQYGYRTSGVVDIHTKSGRNAPSSELSLYGGAHERWNPSFETGGTLGKVDYYLTASYDSNNLGVENPTPAHEAIHDHTEQAKGFAYISATLTPTSRLNFIASASSARFEIPNNPGQAVAFTLPGFSTFDSSQLDERQHEDSHYAVVAFQHTAGDVSLQAVAFTRASRLHFEPDPVGDLMFNGVASDVRRDLDSQGLEFDGRWAVAARHTLRGGLLVSWDRAATDTATAVFATDDRGTVLSNVPFTIADHQRKRGQLYGGYLQDEWKLGDLTVNYGARADAVDAYTRESQLSPRLNAVYTLSAATSLHAGYARYFTPPPLEVLQTGDIAQFANTTNAPELTASSPVRSERSHYFDAGLSHKLTPDLALTLDAYYKTARNQLDEGQFGQALIYAPFNFRTGRVHGVELAANYTRDRFTAYANVAVSRATGREITSGEFQFDPAELAYIAAHDVFLDHDQRLTASTGISYRWTDTLAFADLLYGSGLRRGFANTAKLPAYAPLNLGVEHTFRFGGRRQLRARLEVLNVFDDGYELRDGSGIGVGAPQYGERRSVYGGLSWTF